MKKLNELEDKPRWNNISIDDITETPNETWESCEEVQSIIKTKLGITVEIEIDRSHCITKFQRNKPNHDQLSADFYVFKTSRKFF